MKFSELLKLIMALVGIILLSVSGFFFVENRYTLHTDHVQWAQRVSVNELEDQLEKAREELYYWRKMARKYPDDQEVLKKLKEAEEHVEDLKEKVKKAKEK